MPRPRPDNVHDELDALLDGRPVELTGELAPLAEAAGALRAELAALELDPEVADRHLERVLEGSGRVVPMPVAAQANGWDLRRRVAAVAIAAALVLAPATMASAAALPGQAMYPFKRAIEQLRLASVQWSPSGEAVERTRLADERLEELQRLVELKLYSRLPTAIEALEEAVLAARVAVDEAERDGAAVGGVAEMLDRVKGRGAQVVLQVATKVDQARLPGPTRAAIKDAVEESKDVLPLPDRTVEGTKNPPATGGGTPTTQPPVTAPPTNPTPTTGSTPAEPPPTNPPSATEPTPPPTTAPPTTDPPTTVPPADPPGSADQPAPDGRATDAIPDPTVPSP
jgi:Domain of unknown function (DUF5667)